MDPWGHVADETLGTTTPVRIQSSYDAVTGWLIQRQAGSGSNANNLQNLTYNWDKVGNLMNRQDQIQVLTEAFTYDPLNRIANSTLNGTTNFSVGIDPTGNITTKTDPEIAVTSAQAYTYDPTHTHAVSTVGTGSTQTKYGYDANGNMMTRTFGGTAYSVTWTSFNQPLAVNGPGGADTTYQYGPDHQRRQQMAMYGGADGDTGAETTTYVGGVLEIETTPAQTHYKHLIAVPGGTQIIYDLESSSGSQTTYITSDHLGSGSLLLNSAGTKLIQESFSAYGYRRASNWGVQLAASDPAYATMASTTRRGYTDAFHEVMDNLGLINMNGRIYDPMIGRFLSPDPIIARIGNSQSVNSYGYVQNAPLTLTDPTGLTTQPDCGEMCVNVDSSRSGFSDQELPGLTIPDVTAPGDSSGNSTPNGKPPVLDVLRRRPGAPYHLDGCADIGFHCYFHFRSAPASGQCHILPTLHAAVQAQTVFAAPRARRFVGD